MWKRRATKTKCNALFRLAKRKFCGNRWTLSRFVALLFVSFIVLAFAATHLYVFRDFIYIIRPIFDTKTRFDEIAHFYHESLNDTELCAIHRWNVRTESIRVIDAIIFSVELDLLELRLRELWNVVDRFLILEADRTFSGQTKPTILRSEFRNRLAWAKSKVHIEVVSNLRPLLRSESPFVNEQTMRTAMNAVIRAEARTGDLIIAADVDEIPRATTIELLRRCTGFPLPLHLQLKTYFYSFEFFFSYTDSWRAHVKRYNNYAYDYNHGKSSNYLLADSGWHCTFCLRTLEHFRFKMTSYSHNDRLMGRYELLTDREIQRRICEGKDVFDMFPEVYSFKEMTQKFGSIQKTTSFIDLPRGLIENQNKFRYLLPGNCVREDYQVRLNDSS